MKRKLRGLGKRSSKLLSEQLRENIWSSLLPSFVLASTYFFSIYFRIIILTDPPMGYNLSQYGGVVFQLVLFLFFVFLPLALLMTIVPVFIKDLWVRLMIYTILGIGVARLISPLLGPPSFSYWSVYSLLIIGNVLVVGVYKEQKRKKEK